MLRTYLTPLACALALSHTCIAGETSQLLSSKSVMPEIVEEVQDPWDIDAWIDGFILQLSVNVSQKTLGFEQSVFLGFDDIISNVDWLVPFGADIRYKRFGFMPDFVGLKMSGGSATPGPLYEDLDVSIKMWVLNLAAYYRLIEKPSYSLDVIGGARNLYVDLDLAFSGGPSEPPAVPSGQSRRPISGTGSLASAPKEI